MSTPSLLSAQLHPPEGQRQKGRPNAPSEAGALHLRYRASLFTHTRSFPPSEPELCVSFRHGRTNLDVLRPLSTSSPSLRLLHSLAAGQSAYSELDFLR